MKLIKLLSEEFSMFNQFADEPEEMGMGDPDMGGMDHDENEEHEDYKCQCQCECPCCQKSRAGQADDGQKLDFSAQQTGANMEDPTGGDDSFDFGV